MNGPGQSKRRSCCNLFSRFCGERMFRARYGLERWVKLYERRINHTMLLVAGIAGSALWKEFAGAIAFETEERPAAFEAGVVLDMHFHSVDLALKTGADIDDLVAFPDDLAVAKMAMAAVLMRDDVGGFNLPAHGF